MTASSKPDPILRFFNRAENYARYRPAYPSAIVDLLKEDCHLTAESIIADVGSGTGALAELLLNNGNRVDGIEPNGEMRDIGVLHLKKYPLFASIAATAESTTLADHTIDFVTVGRAYQWFDENLALAEFSRILKPYGWLVIAWIKRRETSEFLKAYEQFLQTHGTDYTIMRQRRAESERQLGLWLMRTQMPVEEQRLDFESLRGLVLSLSNCPHPRDPEFPSMMGKLENLFQRYKEEGRVVLEYDAIVYYRHLPRPL